MECETPRDRSQRVHNCRIYTSPFRRKQERPNNSLKAKKRGEVSMIIALTPTWTAQRNTNQRRIALIAVNTSNRAYEVEIQSRGAQAINLQNGKMIQEIGSSYDTARSRDIPNPMRDKPGQSDVSRRVLWQ